MACCAQVTRFRKEKHAILKRIIMDSDVADLESKAARVLESTDLEEMRQLVAALG